MGNGSRGDRFEYYKMGRALRNRHCEEHVVRRGNPHIKLGEFITYDALHLIWIASSASGFLAMTIR